MSAILSSPSATPLQQFSDNSARSFSVFGEEVADDLLLLCPLRAEELGSAEAGGRNPCGNSLRSRMRRGRALPVVNGNMHSNCVS